MSDVETESFPIVGIGASAGGLEALQELVGAIPSDSGFCYVIVQHLAPDHPSIMDQLLSARTSIDVKKIEDGQEATPDTIFVIPAGPSLTIENGVFRLQREAKKRGMRTPIDQFFASLAEDVGRDAFCIVLSGTGSDGTIGLRAVKSVGGIAVAQESRSARFPGMPDSAIATGLVDFMLRPADMPGRLIDVIRHRERLNKHQSDDSLRSDIEDALPRIIKLIDEDQGQDFSSYKPGTLLRRIERRMMLLKRWTVESFVELLENDPDECEKLLQDFLIGVTRFFRDEKVFDLMRQEIILPLLERQQSKFRIWVPACSTGEEVYSIAMLFAEAKEAAGDHRSCQVFGTDIDLAALSHARRGVYAEGALDGIEDSRQTRFFARDEGGYRVTSELREMCVFAPHNLINDPPFSRLDLISCRNLLIYLNDDSQKRVIPRFHYALNDAGFLLLGPSESLGGQDKYFTTIDRDCRLYQRNDDVRPGYTTLAAQGDDHLVHRTERRKQQRNQQLAPVALPTAEAQTTLEQLAEQHFLRSFAPAFAVIDGRNEVVFLSERMTDYVRPSKGAPSALIESFLVRELRLAVRSAVSGVREGQESVIIDNVVLEVQGEKRLLDVIASPAPFDEDMVMITLERVRLQEPTDLAATAEARSSADRDVLERELKMTRLQLDTSLSDHESTEQELRSSNEELLSMNEELQSSNEELETSREELQSINEELETINAELSENNRQLIQANSDLKNMFESTDFAMLFLDPQLCVRRFTPATADIFGIKERDLGRPLDDLASRIDYAELREDTESVSRSLQPLEKEVRIEATDETYVMRIRPYRTVDDRLDGFVLTFFDITQRMRGERQIEKNARLLAEQYAELETLYDTTPVGLCLLDKELRWLRINEKLAEINGFSIEEHIGARLDELLPDIADKIKPVYQQVLQTGQAITNVEIHGTTPAEPEIERDWIADYYPVSNGDEVFAVGTCVREVTDQKTLQRNLEASERRLRLALEAGRIGVWTLDLETFATERAGYHDEIFSGERSLAHWDVETFRDLIVPEDRDRVFDKFWACAKTGEPLSVAFGVRRADGTIRHVENHAQFVANERGEPKQAIGVVLDMTERKESEDRKSILLEELQHRVKNTLATTLAIIRFSAQNAASADDLARSLEDRLGAIARTHDVLTAKDWEGASLEELVERELAPYRFDNGSRYRYGGATLQLTAKQAMAMALALHELATNAAKHGALSIPEGSIDIVVDVDEANVKRRIEWKEKGGPKVASETAETRRGFGRFLLEQALGADLGGSCALMLEADGLRYQIEM